MDGSITEFFRQLEAGNRCAADAVLAHYFPRLVQFANAILRDRGMPTANAEDAAQSALNSFWQRAEKGQFADYANRDALWRLLATMTRRKVNRQMEREGAAKRGGRRVRLESDLAGSDKSNFRIEDVLEAVPTQEFDLFCEERLLELDEQLREVAVLKMFGHTNLEIADHLKCAERTVERSLRLIRKTWEQELA